MDRKAFAVIFSFCMFNYGLSIPVSVFLNAITVKNCGKSILPPNSPDRIVGGKNVRHGSYPWIVSLKEEDEDGDFEHICGGSVLNENWILTAAHCIDLFNTPSMYQAHVGLHKLSKENGATVQLVKISKIVIHNDYDDETYHNDIALLRTVKPINISGSKGYVNGICLPTSDKDPTGYARVIGWGHTIEDGENSDTLKEVVVPMIPRDLCNEAYDQDPYDGLDEITENMICAGMSGKDSCQNDSGGPLFQTNTKGVSTLIGIASSGVGCGEKYYPGVYTKVSKYRDWMKKVIAK